MLAMAQVEYIKFLREVEGLSINSIAKALGINWRTAKKYADRDNWGPEVKVRQKRYPVLGPYLEIIDAWLMEDMRRKQKQRHTGIRIYHRLRDECGFKGGVRTVTGYVSKRRKELMDERKTYTDLVHPGGEAQVDFGTAEVIHEEAIQEVKYLTISFPYSNAAFLMVLPKENITCFLEGLKGLFEMIGGVPRKIWFDNLSAAVVKVKAHGERQLTEMFRLFKLHYGFEAEFCNTGAGHEKGHVENKVGASRRNWFVPLPVMTSWDQINQHMRQKAEEALENRHYQHNQPIKTLWETERNKLLHLPQEPFEVVQFEAAVLDKYGRARFDQTFLAVPGGTGQQRVALKVYWDRLEVMDEAYQTLGIIPRSYSLKQQKIDWVQELKQVKDKPRALPYTMVYSALPEPLQRYLEGTDLPQRKKRMNQLIKWLHDDCSIDRLAQAIRNTSSHLWNEEGVIYQELYRLMQPDTFESLPEPYTPDEIRRYDPCLEAYDALMEEGWQDA